MQIERFSSLSAVAADEWDAVAGARPLATHGWLLTMEQAALPQRARLYLVGRDSDGFAAALAAEIEQPHELNRSLDEHLFGRGAKAMVALGVGAAPAVVVSAWLARPDAAPDQRRRAAGMLLEALEQIAQDENWSVGFRRVTQGDFDAAGILLGRGYLRSQELPLCCLQIPRDWRSFADYRRALRRQHRATEKSIRGELNDAAKHGLAIERIDDVSRFGPALHALLDLHYQRRNRCPFPYRSDLLERLEANLGQNALIITGEIGGKLAGVSLGVRAGDAVHMAFIGIDQDVGRRASAYFNLSLNRPIEWCIADGIGRMHYGTLAYQVKLQRGCSIIPAGLFVRGRGRLQDSLLRPLLRAHSLRMSRKFRFADRLTAEDQ
jgi:hypothetical protein